MMDSIQKIIQKIGRKYMSKAKPVMLKQTNQQGKKVGADNKACWPGYRYSGTVKGKDVCTKVKK
jgi:hypothetical protein